MGYTVNTDSYMGGGKVYIGPYGGVGALQLVGNSSQFELAVEVDVIEEPDYTRVGGGIRNTHSRPKSVKGTISIFDYSSDNLVKGLQGDKTAVTSGSVAAELHTAYLGGLIPFTYLPDPDATVTPAVTVDDWVAETAYVIGDLVQPVTTPTHWYRCTTAGTSGASEPTWKTDGTTTTDGTVVWADMGVFALTANTDYVRTSAGITIPETGGRLLDGVPLTIAYTKHISWILEALTALGNEYRIFFEGFNEFDSGQPAFADIFKAKIAPMKSLKLISDNQEPLVLEFTGLSDDTQAVGKSKFFRTTLTKRAA